MIQRFPHPVLVLAFFILIFGRMESPAADVWDATSLDVHGENISLNGIWDYVPLQNGALDQLPNFDNAEKVPVPRTQMEGAYRTTFSLSKEQTEGWSALHFDAVAFQCSVFLNGKLVGNHVGGMTPFEIDVSGKLQEGGNEMVVLVLGDRARILPDANPAKAALQFNERGQALPGGGGKLILGGGMFPVPGIPQDVFLRKSPLLRVGDATVTTSFRRKLFGLRVDIENQSSKDAMIQTRLDILPYDIPSKTIGETPVWTKSENFLARKGSSVQEITQLWPDPKLWMPGDPHLYVARIRLSDQSGKLLSERNIRFGFREVWLDGTRIIVNGLPFRAFVHGSLDAEASPEVTRAMFQQVMALGINMVRPHTRPPVPSVTQIADEMGVGIIAESELCFNSNNAYENPVFWANLERSFAERIARDKNHPSILIWSLANEVIITSPGVTTGQKFYDLFLKLRQLDPTRPFMQEGDGDLRDMLPDAKGFPIDIINIHPYDVSPRKNPLWTTEFPTVAWVLEQAKTPADIPAANKFGALLPDRRRPWFMGEFGFAQLAYPDFISFWTGPSVYRDLFGDATGLVRSLGELTILQLQAYRDMGMAGMDPWDMPDRPPLAPYLKRGLEPVTTFTRDMLAHWTGGEIATRRMVTLNDSFQTQKLTLTISVRQGETDILRKAESFILEPGGRRDTPWQGLLPRVGARTPLRFVVQLSNSQGQVLSSFQQDWIVYPEINPVREWRTGKVWLFGSPDNLGAIAKWAGERLRPASTLTQIDQTHPDVVIADQPTISGLNDKARQSLDRYVEDGGVLFISGADRSLSGQPPLAAYADSDSTRLFLLRPSPLTAGTTDGDWEFWRPDYLLTQDNFIMSFDPAFDYPLIAGGRNGLMYAPLAISRKGRGAVIVSRLLLDKAIESEPVARLLLNNLIPYAASLARFPVPMDSRLVISCAPTEQAAWTERMRAAGIPTRFDGPAPVPGKDIAFLSGNSTPSPEQLDKLAAFVNAGGTLWLHRLTSQTSYLPTVSQWLGQPVDLRAPKMWLPQLVVAPSPLLDGINDFTTCWATFCWTNGDSNSIRMTPIVDFVLPGGNPKVSGLLNEPPWVGTWDFKPDGYLLTQAIMIQAGKHTSNENPGAGLATFPMGKGRILIDQIRWDDVMLDTAGESKDKARYLVGTLWKNLTTPQPR